MAMTKKEKKELDLKFLKLLSHNFPDVATASTEIINLSAILNLPKGTEHFLADLHGEYKAFQHVLRNASGTIKRKVGEIFGDTLSLRDQKEPRQNRVQCSPCHHDLPPLNGFFFRAGRNPAYAILS